MKVSELIALADGLAANPFDTTVKLFEFNRLEARIRVDVLKEDPDDVEPVTAADAATTDLTLADRYHDVYLFWMKSMFYWHMGEHELYQNEKAMFDAAWTRWERDVCNQLHRGSCAPEAEFLAVLP